MDYNILYEIEFGSNDLQFIFLPIVLIMAGLFVARLIKKYSTSPPFGLPRLFPQWFMRNSIRFFSFLVASFGFLLLILFFVKISRSIIHKKEIKNALEQGTIEVVEGKVCDYIPVEDVAGDTESFRINNVKFEYSEDEDIYGYHTTSNQNRLIKKNGQDLKITYYTINDEKIILKIEEPINY